MRQLFLFKKLNTIKSKLDTDNPEYLQWHYGQVKTKIFGGVRIEGLDRMRVTVKVDYNEQVICHNLDLSNEAKVDRLVRRCAERFSLGTAMYQT